MKSELRNWSDIRAFLAVVREGSTLAASRKLGVAQPTVARRIDALEHATGLTLFGRDTRGFTPTDAGRALFDLAVDVESAVDAFAAKAGKLGGTTSIRITAFAGNFSPRMVDIVNAFSALNPGVSFEFLPSVRTLDLIGGEADIALRVARTDPDPSLICRKISDARWALFGGIDYAEKFGLPGSPDELGGHKFVSFQKGGVADAFQQWLLSNVRPEQIVATYSELDLMHAAIRSGVGLGISNVRLSADDDAMVQCWDEIAELSVPQLLLVAPEAYRRAEVRKFVKFFAPRYAALFR